MHLRIGRVSMASSLLLLLPAPLNSHRHSSSTLSLTPIPLRFRNPNLASLKFNTNQRHALIVRALEEDSNPETVQDGEVNNLGVKAALSMLRFYKREISPILPKSCRYVPTCSEYSMEAYKRYGVVKGTVLTAWRLCRCNPLGGYGYDPPRWFGEISPHQEVDK